MKSTGNYLSMFLESSLLLDNITSLHISLYTAIYEKFIRNNFTNPFNVSRRELMKISRIRSKTTYHKCLNDLINMGFLDYSPSYNPYIGSEVELIGKKINSSDILKLK